MELNQQEVSEVEQPVETPPHPPNSYENSPLDCLRTASNWLSSPSLFPRDGGDSRQDKAWSNVSNSKTRSVDSNGDEHTNLQGVEYIQQVLFQIKAQQEAYQEARRTAQRQHQRIKSEAQQQQQITQMQQYLLSGDPILVAEARAWAEVNSDVLKENQLQLPLTQSRFTYEPID